MSFNLQSVNGLNRVKRTRSELWLNVDQVALSGCASKKILDLLEIVIHDGVTIVKFRVNSAGGEDTRCFKIKIQKNTASSHSQIRV